MENLIRDKNPMLPVPDGYALPEHCYGYPSGVASEEGEFVFEMNAAFYGRSAWWVNFFGSVGYDGGYENHKYWCLLTWISTSKQFVNCLTQF